MSDDHVLFSLIDKGAFISKDFRIDVLVSDENFIEIKVVESLPPVHEVQIVKYLQLTG